MNTQTSNTVPQQIAVVVKFHSATNFLGSRFSLSLPRWKNKKRLFSYDHSFNDTLDNALAVFTSHNVPAAAILDVGTYYVLTVDWKHRPQVFAMMGLKES